MSKSPITHAAALKALTDLYDAVLSPYKTQADLAAAVRQAYVVISATHTADPASLYCAAKQAKEAAKARLKASRRRE
jgi:hypothetical protein